MFSLTPKQWAHFFYNKSSLIAKKAHAEEKWYDGWNQLWIPQLSELIIAWQDSNQCNVSRCNKVKNITCLLVSELLLMHSFEQSGHWCVTRGDFYITWQCELYISVSINWCMCAILLFFCCLVGRKIRTNFNRWFEIIDWPSDNHLHTYKNFLMCVWHGFTGENKGIITILKSLKVLLPQ